MERMRMQFLQDPNLYNPEQMGSKYGHIPGFMPGAVFNSRRACCAAGVHGASVAGIHASNTGSAYSVCLSKGYEDDKDYGDIVLFTGAGGQDRFSTSSSGSKQISDQSFGHLHNASLKVSVDSKLPVRLVRGPNEKSKWAPTSGYRYDGLYQVVKAYEEEGISGFLVCKFELRRLEDEYLIPVKW